jgi:hypothetical protein
MSGVRLSVLDPSQAEKKQLPLELVFELILELIFELIVELIFELIFIFLAFEFDATGALVWKSLVRPQKRI